jgi:hypothetical protein
MSPRRRKLPKTERFGVEETRVLYNRYSATKNKAQRTEIEFPWPEFHSFFDTVLSIAPDDYTPSAYHLVWGETGKDYRKEAIQFKRVNEPQPSEIAVELTALLTGLEYQQEEPIQLAELANIAAALAAT